MDEIGRYRVVRPLGRGGMGHVYLAEDPKLERQLALKLLHRDPTHAGVRSEAKALAALRHPGIVTIYEIGEHDNREFIAMEFVPGRTLRDLIATGTRDTLIAIVAKVARAVAHAHAQGILHRDIKPENILVGDAGEVKVVDFGLARRLEGKAPTARVTAQDFAAILAGGVDDTAPDTLVEPGTQTIFGTPAYMAPETLHGDPTTPASDVYSLGVVAYECIAGKRPFVAANVLDLISLVVETDAPVLADAHAPLIARMLARDPTKRPTLAEVADALEPQISTGPLPAPSPKKPARWPYVALGVAALAAATVVIVQRETAAPPAPPSDHPLITVAFRPIDAKLTSYGIEQPHPWHLANATLRLLTDAEGARFKGVEVRPDRPDIHADFIVGVTIRQIGELLHAHVDVVESATDQHRLPIELEAARIAPLVARIADATARAIVPGASVSTKPDRVRAEALVQLGIPWLDRGRFNDARPYLEQAAETDPTYADAWYYLTVVLGWTEAPEQILEQSAHHAVETAPVGRRRELMRGVELFTTEHFREARAQLEMLDNDPPHTEVEVLYYLGDATWHDGLHARAYEYFKRALDRSTFLPPALHAGQYLLAIGDCDGARFMLGRSGEMPDALMVCSRQYKELATSGISPGFRMAGYILTDQEAPADVRALAYMSLDDTSYRVARALQRHDLAGARGAFSDGWKQYAMYPDPSPQVFYAIEQLAEITISGELPDETRTLVDYLAAHSQHRAKRGFHRFAALAAPITGDKSAIVRTGISTRDAQLVDAVDAELAGDHAKAVAIYEAVLADPGFFWEYPERISLIRNLRALHREADVQKYCKDWMHPPIFRLAWLPLRETCRATAKGSPVRDSRADRRR